MLTREMKMAYDKLKVQLESADDFPVALRVFRLGLLMYGVLSEEDLQAMYCRRLIDDSPSASSSSTMKHSISMVRALFLVGTS